MITALLRRLLPFALCALLPAAAQAQEPRKVFFFGNSLIHHLSDTPETTVPYWLAELMAAGGHGFASDGTWGFPAAFARDLPPPPQWQFPNVARVMSDDPRSFRMAGFDDVILSPPNFVQWAPPERDTLDGSMLELIGRNFAWLRGQGSARLYLYEGWADMDSFGFPPSARNWTRYHDLNQSADYHGWYVDLAAKLSTSESPVTLIPVAPVLSAMAQGPLAALGPTDLYSDDAPHGTPTTYLLAAMVTYSTLMGAPPPPLDLPETIAPLVRESYPAVAAALWAELAGMQAPEGAALIPAEGGWDNPSLALGLSGVEDWATQQPFLDLMKTARPWIGHLPGRWGGVSFDDLRSGGYLDAQGWPLAIPAGVEALETMVLTDMPPEARGLAGRYVVTWQGKGDLTLGGRAQDVRLGEGAAEFSYTPGEGLVSLRLTAIDPADPLRQIRIFRAEDAPLIAAGALFNPRFIARVADARVLRFMDWMRTNGSPVTRWEERAQISDASYVMRGVPLEVMIALANQIGADPWFTLPHGADDDYAARFAAMAFAGVDPALVVHAEWSNEVWNFQFPQAAWSRDQAQARWGADLPDDAWMQFAGTRAAEVADIWAAAFASAPERLLRIVATHTGWPGLEEPLLTAPLRQAEGLPPPAASFDAYAVSGYFGFEIGNDDRLGELRDWIARGTATTRAADMIRAGSLSELTRHLWPHHALAARAHGLDLVMYEGGSHVVAHGAGGEDEAVTRFLTAFSYSPEMAALYSEAIAAWRQVGDGPFMAFVDVAKPSRWGSWGALRHLDDVNPRWATLWGWNSLPQGALAGERRPAPRGAAFTHGLLVQGDERATAPVGEAITGTAKADILIGGAGDDILVAGGGDDLIHGGAGHDRALLPGQMADWTPASDGEGLWMLSRHGAVRLVAVEEITFAADPETVFHPPQAEALP